MWVRQPHKQRSPVIDERHHACHESTPGKILGGEAAPAPLIFQFIEVVFGIGPVTIELGEREYLVLS